MRDDMSDLKLIARIASAFHDGGDVTPLRPKTKVPTLLIAGRKYALSTDGGPLGDADDPESEAMLGGGRLIRGPVGNKWKYLWVYNTDRQRLVMWRASDGNEKVEDSARSQSARIVKLDRKGQLNRVTQEEFRRVEAFMRKQEDDTLAALKKTWEQNKGDFQREVDEALSGLLDTLRPKLEAELNAIDQGATPFGWRPPTGVHERYVERSKRTFVISRFMEREFSLDKAENYLRARGFDLENNDNQATQWARDELIEATYERYLPARPEDDGR